MTPRAIALAELYSEGLTYKQIARVHGGTHLGVRSTLRRLRERGLIPPRERIEWPVPKL